MDKIILLSGSDKGALKTPNFELNKKKEGKSEDVEDDYELSQERFLQSSSRSTNTTKSGLVMEIQELACKITQLEVPVKDVIPQVPREG